ncbi:MAG: nuclear transport factor 2 family protein [Chloroflexota bacterium]
MIDQAWAVDFAEKWIAAFNSHDLDRIFELYDDRFEMRSPYIISRMGLESGRLVGKEQVRPYWSKSVGPESTLRFELIDVFVGVDSVVVYYKSAGAKYVCETFQFNPDGKVISGCSQHGRSIESE